MLAGEENSFCQLRVINHDVTLPFGEALKGPVLGGDFCRKTRHHTLDKSGIA